MAGSSSIAHLQIVAQQPEAGVAAAFRMKLRAQDPATAGGGRKRTAVQATGKADVVRRSFRRVTVDEIDVAIQQSLEQGMICRLPKAIPADVWHGHLCWQPGDPSRQQAQAIRRLELLARLEKELKADADPEQPSAPYERFAKRLLHGSPQGLPRRRERPDSRQKKTAARRNPRWIASDLRRGTQMLQGAHEVAEVTNPGVDDGHLFHAERVPLVLGTSVNPARTATAALNARAAALKAASAA